MSNIVNPYALSSWAGAATTIPSSTSHFLNYRVVHPSVLKVPGSSAPFDILASVVLDPSSRRHFALSTDILPTSVPATTIHNSRGVPVGTVQWYRPHPTVEMRNQITIPRKTTPEFFRATSQSEHIMSVAGREYAWVSTSLDQKVYSINAATRTTELVAVIVRGNSGDVTISVAPSAVQEGLLDALILALLLVCSGHMF